METLKLTLLKKNVYGNTLYYPKCDISKLICELMSKKTFTDRDLYTIDLHKSELVKVEIKIVHE